MLIPTGAVLRALALPLGNKMKVSIETTDSRLYYGLAHDFPEGVSIISEPPMIRKGFDVDVVVNIDIAIDLTKISAVVVGAWLYKNARQSKGRSDVYVDGKQIPVNQPEIEKQLQEAIEHKESKDDQKP